MLHLLLLPVVQAAPAAPALLPALSGQWRLAEPRAAVEARRDSAIDTLLGPFNLLIRGVARPLLVQAATVCDGYRTTLAPSAFTVACDGIGEVTAAFDQPPKAGVAADGRAYRLRAGQEGGRVTFDFDGEAGVQHVVYEATAEGHLRVRKTIHSDRLNADLSWEMRYSRL